LNGNVNLERNSISRRRRIAPNWTVIIIIIGLISSSSLLLLLLLVSISDEVDLWFPLDRCRWSSDFDIILGFSLLKEDIHEVFVFILFWKDNFSLGSRVLGWSLHEDNVNVLVSSWHSDGSGLAVDWFVWSSVDVHLDKIINI